MAKAILVVDDDRAIRSMTARVLTEAGFRVFEADSGEAGLRAAREQAPDLILSDVEMPGTDGHAMLLELHADPITASIPLIFLTGRSDQLDIRFGMNLGADDYLTKPFPFDELLRVVKSRLARRDALRARYEEKLEELRCGLATSLPHEFRTPLNGILGYAAILAENPGEFRPDELTAAAAAIRSSGERLQRYVENFLIYAELAGAAGYERALPLAPEVVPCDVAACAERVAQARAKQHGRERDLQASLGAGTVDMPAAYLTRVLDEIVDNAFRYSTRDTPVTVACESEDRMVRIVVRDHGAGMTPDQLRAIDAFVQFDRQRQEQQGLGMGIAIAKGLVQRCGGVLEIEADPGAKTRVTILLPVARDADVGSDEAAAA